VTGTDRTDLSTAERVVRRTTALGAYWSKAENREPVPLALGYAPPSSDPKNKMGAYATLESEPAVNTISASITAVYASGGLYGPTCVRLTTSSTNNHLYMRTAANSSSYPVTIPANKKWVLSLYAKLDDTGSPKTSGNMPVLLILGDGSSVNGPNFDLPNDGQWNRYQFAIDLSANASTTCRVRIYNRCFNSAGDTSFIIDGLQLEEDPGDGQATPFLDPGTSASTIQAQAELDRWWETLYHVRRRFYTFDVPINSALFSAAVPELGQFCSLQSDRFLLLDTPKKLFIRGLEFNYSKNLVTIEGWG